MSFLTNKTLDLECEDLLSPVTGLCLSFTLTHLTTTYIFIKIYLRVKHSRTIRIAEEKNSDFSILDFKKLLMLLFLLCICMFCRDLVRQKQIYMIQADPSPPPMLVLSAVVGSLWSTLFIWTRKDIRAFVKRKIRGQFEYLFPNLNWRKTKIEPAKLVPNPDPTATASNSKLESLISNLRKSNVIS